MNISRRDAVASVGLTAIGLSEPQVVLGEEASVPTIRIDHLPVEVCAELFYDQELGFFKKAGFNVQLQEFASAGATASALLGNSLDVAMLDTVSLLIVHSRNIPIVFLASGKPFDGHAPNYGTIRPADSSIRAARDFSGTFAVCGLNGIAALGIPARSTETASRINHSL
jgi:ABC-type nitrate/sulfonate/bicarbonate transport system substrate-binding protein